MRCVDAFRRAGPALALVAINAVLVVSGRSLPAPSLHHPGGWLEAVGPVAAAAALLRLVALGVAALLLGVSIARVVAAWAGAVRVAAALDHALPAPLRRVLAGVAGAGAAGSVLLGVTGPPPSAASASSDPVVATLAEVPAATMAMADPPPATVDPPAEASMQVVSEPASAAGDHPDEWVVAPGESFWSIAEEVVAERLGRRGTDAEVAGYWAQLVDANRDRLVTADPDLIYPGQQLVLVG